MFQSLQLKNHCTAEQLMKNYSNAETTILFILLYFALFYFRIQEKNIHNFNVK